MKKIAVNGYSGKIASKLIGLGAIPLRADITNKTAVERELSTVMPDVIIHAAAISSIDKCQIDYEKAISVNVYGTNIVCETAEEVVGKEKVVLISSEQVFDGVQGNYTEKSEPFPINNYGMTKLGAEGVAQLYGAKILRLSRGASKSDMDISKILSGEEKNVPNFIFRSYIHLDFLAQGIWNYATRFEEMPELLHYGGSEAISFYSFAMMLGASVQPREEEVAGFSPRPLRCGFDISLARKHELPIFTPSKSAKKVLSE